MPRHNRGEANPTHTLKKLSVLSFFFLYIWIRCGWHGYWCIKTTHQIQSVQDKLHKHTQINTDTISLCLSPSLWHSLKRTHIYACICMMTHTHVSHQSELITLTPSHKLVSAAISCTSSGWQRVTQQCLQSKHLPQLQGLPPPFHTLGEVLRDATLLSSPSLYEVSFSVKWPFFSPNITESDWWDYNNVDSYMHNGQLTVTGVRKAQCWADEVPLPV